MNKKTAPNEALIRQEFPLRPLHEVLSEIKEMFDREGWLGVQGFSITLRSKVSSSNMRWGDLKLRRFTSAPSVGRGGDKV